MVRRLPIEICDARYLRWQSLQVLLPQSSKASECYGAHDKAVGLDSGILCKLACRTELKGIVEGCYEVEIAADRGFNRVRNFPEAEKGYFIHTIIDCCSC